MRYTFKLALSLLLITPFFALAAQSTVYGNWVFEDFVNRDKIDPVKLVTLEDIFGKMFMNFQPDGSYKAGMMGQKDEGTWELGEGSLSMQSDKPAKPVVLSQLEIGGREMSFVMTQVHIKMKRAGSMRSAEPPVPPTPPLPPAVSATSEQITAKWNLTIRTIPNMTAQQKEMSEKFSAGAYFQFKSNGKFKSELLGVKDKGSWKFGEENKSLIVTGNNGSNSWKNYRNFRL